MPMFDLPKETLYGRVIPKNAFDEYTNSKQKKALSDTVKRITWTHKLSTKTTNLPFSVVKEIQIFTVELKVKADLKKTLEIIDKSIPYHIIFIQTFGGEVKFSTTAKHLHVTKLNQSVLDCTFTTGWTKAADRKIDLVLKDSLEQVYLSLCNQLTGRNNRARSYTEFMDMELKIKVAEIKVKRLQAKISSEKQFNRKVALNMELNEAIKELGELRE